MADTKKNTESDALTEETAGMRFAFWSWAVIVAGGLAIMIVLPLMGR